MSIRRVLMTADTVGGVWTFAIELARELGRRNIEVALLTMGADPVPAQRAEAGGIRNLCLISSPYRLEWMEDPWTDVEKANTWIRGIVDEYSPDILHFNSFGQGNRAWPVPVVLTAHSCVRTWWRAVHNAEAPAEWNRYSALVRDALAAADILTVPSKSLGRAMAAEYERFPECKVIPNGRDPRDFRQAQKEPFIFTAGRLWDEAKNLRILAAIARDLSWPVYIAGETGKAPIERCRSLGRLSGADIRDWYARASIYAMPARYEPFGLSFLEAALSGCAIVAGDIPSLREVWGDAALFSAPDDQTALAHIIQRLIDDPSLRRDMAERARCRAMEFTSAKTADLYLAAYKEAAAKRSRVCAS